jgi:hypothetical protein
VAPIAHVPGKYRRGVVLHCVTVVGIILLSLFTFTFLLPASRKTEMKAVGLPTPLAAHFISS